MKGKAHAQMVLEGTDKGKAEDTVSVAGKHEK